MTAPTDLESRLRTLLHDRAEEISGPAPGLPAAPGAVGTGTAPAIGRRAGRGRPLLAISVAAAVVVVALVVTRGPSGSQDVVTTQPPSPTAGLPAEFDPATAGRVMRIERVRDPEAAARRYLGWRLVDPARSPDQVAEAVRVDVGDRSGAIVPVSWRHADGSVGGSVIVRVGERGSDIVAATTPGVDLSAVRMDGERAVGRVRTGATAPQGPALVDVLPAGHAFPVSGTDPALPTEHGYGSAARGEEPFSVGTDQTDPIVSVRFTAGREVTAISELALAAPLGPAPDFEGWTNEQWRAYFDAIPPDPRCTAADEDLLPRLGEGLSDGDATAPRERAADGIFATAGAVTPTAAVTAAIAGLGAGATDITVTAPLTGGGIAGAWVDDAPVEAWVRQDGDRFLVTGLTTASSCWAEGKGNLTPEGSPYPATRLDLSRVAGAFTGRVWYGMTDGTTWTVALDSGDLARGQVAVVGESANISQMAMVVRARDGRVVLVQQTTF